MLIVALVLAVVGLAALVTAVVTSNELIAWVCIAASVIGVLLLIVDALRSKSGAGDESDEVVEETDVVYDEDYPEEAPVASEYDNGTVEDAPSEAEPGPYDNEETAAVTAEDNPRAESAGEDNTTR